TCRRFLDDLYVHTQPLPAAAWRAWAASDECLGALRRRWATLGLGGAAVEHALAAAVADPEWFPLAALDATTRLLTAMVHAGGLRRGPQATGAWTTFLARASQEGPERTHTVPAAYWMVRPAPPGPDGDASLLMRGAVLVRVRGGQAFPTEPAAEATPLHRATSPPLPPDLAAVSQPPPTRPGRQLLHLLRADGLLTPSLLGLALSVAAGSVVVEALLWRGLVDLSRDLGLVHQRLGVLGALCALLSVLLLLDLGN